MLVAGVVMFFAKRRRRRPEEEQPVGKVAGSPEEEEQPVEMAAGVVASPGEEQRVVIAVAPSSRHEVLEFCDVDACNVFRYSGGEAMRSFPSAWSYRLHVNAGHPLVCSLVSRVERLARAPSTTATQPPV